MKKGLTISILSGLCLLLAQCAPKSPSNASSGMSASEEVAAIKKKYTQEQIDHGKAISLNNCNKCHRYHEPGEFTVSKWERTLRVMIPKAQLNETDGGMVSAYILTNAKLN